MAIERGRELIKQVEKLACELDKRATRHDTLTSYRDGDAPLPAAVKRAKLTSAYQVLMPFASSNWGGLIVDSVLDRLEPTGIRSEDSVADKALWGFWQDNQMDLEAKLGHDSTLTDGRAFALVWPDANGNPEITLDDSSQMIIAYREGRRRPQDAIAALRRWVDDDERPYATLYRPDGIFKFVGPKGATKVVSSPAIQPLTEDHGSVVEYVTKLAVADKVEWEPRIVGDEQWPLENPLGIVPAVELAVNRRLKSGMFPAAFGEFERSTGHIDRINILTFLGLVVAFWMGFPLRTVVGEKILKDDDGNTLPPFEAMADSVGQFENPNVKLEQFDAADLKNLSVEEHVKQLAAICKTPAHYLIADMVNLSADAIRAAEASLVSKVNNHKTSLGEAWEQVLRLGGLMLDNPVDLSPRAELLWEDHEARSMAERADAAVKLKDILPWQPLAEKVLGATQEEIARWESMRSASALDELVASMGANGNAPESTPPNPESVPAAA